MRVAFVLLSLLSLLCLAPTPSSGLGADLLKFRQLTAAAPWPGRRQAWVRQLSSTVSFNSRGSNLRWTNPLALMGGFVPEWDQVGGGSDRFRKTVVLPKSASFFSHRW